MNWSLRTRFLFPTLAVILVGMGVATVVSFFNSRQQLVDQAMGQVEQIAGTTATLANDWLTERQRNVRLWAERQVFYKVVAETSPETVQAANIQMGRYQKEYPFYESLNAAPPGGIVVSSNNSKVINKVSVKERGYFKESMTGKDALSPVILSKATGDPVIAVSSPINPKHAATPAGVLLCIIDLGQFSKVFVDPIKIGEKGKAYVVDGQGRVIASPDKAAILKTDISKLPFGREILAQKSGTISYAMGGQEYMAAFRQVPGRDWIVVAAADEDELMAGVWELGYINALIALLVLICAGLVVFFVARSVVRPIVHNLSELDQGAQQVATAAQEVSSSSQALAQGASEQAASLEESSASMEEMASMTRTNADHAKEADSLMGAAGSLLREANTHMKDLGQAVQRIDAASDEMAKIIKSIDEIAFQTNLLALNAAVEAARAGEAGAGFAVVADEVRNLAMRAAEAAKSTGDLIQRNLGEIKTASQLMTTTDESFGQVESSAAKVSGLISEIAAASTEQAQGIDQVNRAISEMDKVTQQTAASAEESAAASEELNAQAETIEGLVAAMVGMVSGDRAKAASQQATARAAAPPRRRAAPAALPAPKAKPKAPAPKAGQGEVADDDFADF